MPDMLRSPLVRHPAPAPFDKDAARRRLLALRGNCRRHGSYPLNVIVRGHPVASGCPGCGQAPR